MPWWNRLFIYLDYKYTIPSFSITVPGPSMSYIKFIIIYLFVYIR
jgi:hypothetical protein